MDLRTQAQAFTTLLHNHFRGDLIAVVLFGSVACNTARPDSDIDLVVVLRELPPGRLQRRMLLEPLFEQAPQRGLTAPFNCHLKTPAEAQKISVMYLDFPTDAQILHDTDGFFHAIIHTVAEKIRATGAVRKPIGKFYYWDLKPGAHADDTFEIL